ncbi:MAG: hypothetical protein OEY34_07085, partial [Cyclobacteriaceae bacterium]|nr:hypothetical protein [Cyclobacteriaceae bacterium]
MRGIMLRFGVLTLLLVLNCNIGIFAQSYGSTLGIRLGDDPVKRTAGLSFQYRFLKRATLEGILQSDFSYNTTFHGLVKQHHPIITKRVNLFVGTGISFGSEQSEVVNTL